MPYRFSNISLFCLLFGFLALFTTFAAAQEWGKEDWVVIYTAAEEPGAMQGYAAQGNAVAMDSEENVYVLGEASIPDRRTDVVIYKYLREDGSVVWRDVYNHADASSPGADDGSMDLGAAVATDAQGGTYAAINSGHELFQKDYRVVIRKYGPHHATGEEPDWTHVYGSADDGDQEAHAIVPDGAGNCFVAGVNDMDGMLFKVNADGSLGNVNVRETRQGQGGWTYFYDLALDISGNIYVCGQAQLPGDPVRQDNLVARYSPSGVLQWLTFFGDSNGQHNLSRLALSPDCSAVYAAGRHLDGDQKSYWSVVRFAADTGVKQWHDHFQGSDVTGTHYPTAVAMDTAGNLLVAGIATQVDTGADMTVVKYEGAPEKNRLWAASYSGDTPSSWETAVGVGTDSADNVYVAGRAHIYGSPETVRSDDFATVKYSPAGGSPVWARHYDHALFPGQSEYPAAMAVAPSGTVAVTGRADTQGAVLFPMVTVLYAGDEDPSGQTPPTRPVFTPVPHVKAAVPSSAGQGTVTYTYEWSSSDGQHVVFADRTETEGMLYPGENGITFSTGQTWTVTITPKSGGLTGPAFTGRFTIGDAGSVHWGDTPDLGDAVHILQVLSGAGE